MNLQVALLLFVAAISSFAARAEPALPLQYQDHVLVEKIYDVEKAQFITRQSLLQIILASRYILLGETHDNSRHHAIQRLVMEHLGQHYPSTSVSFEMIDVSQARALGNLNSYTSDTLIDKLEHPPTGWQYDTYYRALFETALANRLPILSANIPKETLHAFMKGEDVVLDKPVEKMLTDMQLDPELEASLLQEIVDSHCGMLNHESAAPMVEIQRLRDIAMTLSLLDSTAEKRLLIAGVGHVRHDRGVPYYLIRKETDATIMTLGMVEVEPEKTSVEQYLSRWSHSNFPFDYIWFTASADRPDPCMVFHSQGE